MCAGCGGGPAEAVNSIHGAGDGSGKVREPHFQVLYRQLTFLLLPKHKVQMVLLVVFSIGASLVDAVGVSSIMPFISIAADTGRLDSGLYKKVYDFFHFENKITFVIAFGFAIIAFNIFRTLYNVAYTYGVYRFSNGIFRYVSGRLFRTCLALPYLAFTRMNSAELTKVIVNDAANIRVILSNILLLFSDFFVVLLFYGFMVAVQWQATIIITIILGGIAFLIVVLITRTGRRLGARRSESYSELYKILRKTFGNFKFIRMKNDEKNREDEFNGITKDIARSETVFYTLNAMPRSILETIGFSLLIGVVMVMLWRYPSIAMIIPVISMYALGLYRILPSINRIMGNMNSISFFLRSMEAACDNLRQETLSEGNEAVSFNREICINNISFNYVAENRVLHDITLTIRKGEKVAVIGESGSGKSTLIDLLIGIHKPGAGKLLVDGVEITDANVRSWRARIGYIPQDVYLFDGTVGENVSLGAEFDRERVERALKRANIWEFLEGKEGIDTPVGEGGIQLSGGQKQRIGIARALYTDPEVLVLDEATSSLDMETEEKIMDEVYGISRDKTLVVIAHRLSTVERCEWWVELAEGRVIGKNWKDGC